MYRHQWVTWWWPQWSSAHLGFRPLCSHSVHYQLFLNGCFFYPVIPANPVNSVCSCMLLTFANITVLKKTSYCRCLTLVLLLLSVSKGKWVDVRKDIWRSNRIITSESCWQKTKCHWYIVWYYMMLLLSFTTMKGIVQSTICKSIIINPVQPKDIMPLQK